MADCKECIHEFVCSINGNEPFEDCFEPKSRFVELPCVPKDDEYYRVYDEHENHIAVIYFEEGKATFYTREEAENALKEMGK